MSEGSVMPEYFETGSKKPGRGMAQRSLDLIEAMREIAEELQPITGRGIGYQLFTRKLIASMARTEMARVYRLLKEARERGIIPWSWIVDETRSNERVSTWDDPDHYARCVAPLLSPRLLEPAAAPREAHLGEGHRARRARPGARSLRGRLSAGRRLLLGAPRFTTSPRMTTAGR